MGKFIHLSRVSEVTYSTKARYAGIKVLDHLLIQIGPHKVRATLIGPVIISANLFVKREFISPLPVALPPRIFDDVQ
jgi:hypothetical protein